MMIPPSLVVQDKRQVPHEFFSFPAIEYNRFPMLLRRAMPLLIQPLLPIEKMHPLLVSIGIEQEADNGVDDF